ncbi:MAG TPA: JAB domain-containing protein [Puia sp.]|nr:JAB domain-containing protein [Puia sp.]
MADETVTEKKTTKAGIPEIVLSYRNKTPVSQRIKVDSTLMAVSVFWKTWNKRTFDLFEEFKVMLLNNTLDLLGILPVAKGGIKAALVDPRLIYAAALKASATSIIMAHNHPSGQARPSAEDIVLTDKIRKGASTLEINLLDHLILTRDSFYSFGQAEKL